MLRINRGDRIPVNPIAMKMTGLSPCDVEFRVRDAAKTRKNGESIRAVQADEP